MKIVLNDQARPDKAGIALDTESEKAIADLLLIQDCNKMYINEKKQLQSLIYKLYELGYYKKFNSVLDDLGITVLQ